MTCSSSPTWAYMARKISFSPGNTNVGLVDMPNNVPSSIPSLPCYSITVSTQSLFRVITWPLGLICEKSFLELGRWVPASPLVSSWLCKSRHCGSRSPLMVLPSYFFLTRWKSWPATLRRLSAPNMEASGQTVGRPYTPAYQSSKDRSLGRSTESCSFCRGPATQNCSHLKASFGCLFCFVCWFLGGFCLLALFQVFPSGFVVSNPLSLLERFCFCACKHSCLHCCFAFHPVVDFVFVNAFFAVWPMRPARSVLLNGLQKFANWSTNPLAEFLCLVWKRFEVLSGLYWF